MYALGTASPLKQQGRGIEGVHKLVQICGLRWWEVSMQRLGEGGGY